MDAIFTDSWFYLYHTWDRFLGLVSLWRINPSSHSCVTLRNMLFLTVRNVSSPQKSEAEWPSIVCCPQLQIYYTRISCNQVTSSISPSARYCDWFTSCPKIIFSNHNMTTLHGVGIRTLICHYYAIINRFVIDYILITNLMHWLFIHKILFSSTCFEPQVLIFRRIQLYTCNIWYCHSLWEFLVACRYTLWVSSHSSCGPTDHQELSQRVRVPYAACIQLYPSEDEHLRLETCREE